MRYRTALLTLAAALGILLVASLLLLTYVRTSVVDAGRDAALPRLEAPVEVWRDSMGVPHIWAETEADLFRAQGYVHAQDRLWQLELLRRVAEGRLAEVLGEELVETDRFLRVLGHWRAAGLREEALDPDVRVLLEAYAAGVNAWIEGRRGALPPEFLILRVQPGEWTVRHTLAIETLMAWDLATYGMAERLARSVQQVGEEWASVLAPSYPSWGPTILDGLQVRSAQARRDADGEREACSAEPCTTPAPPPIPAPAAAFLGGVSISRASNSWVIGGSRTRSGKPLLANDMHLELRAPSLWYLNALHAERAANSSDGLHVAGLSLPGAPLVVAGHNRALAWGYTNAYVQDVDLVRERLDPSDPESYLTPEGPAPFEIVRERIEVRGADSAVVAPVRWTRNGPVLEDATVPADEVMALRWVAHQPTRTLQGLLGMNRAVDWDTFLAGVRDFNNPHQNIVYADTAGHIGYVMGGRVPIRGEGKPPSLLPVPGWTGEWDWTGWLDFERHPRTFDPARDYIVTANNRQANDSLVDLIGSYWETPFRAIRIEEMIRDGRAFDVESVAAMQANVHDAFAERYVGQAVSAARRAGLEDAAAKLAAWDRRASTDSEAAALFNLWVERLRAGLAQSLYGYEDGWIGREAVMGVLERRALPWVHEESPETFDAVAATALEEAVEIAAGREWGELHAVSIGHALGSVDILDRVLRLNIGPVPHGGSPMTVNVSHYGRSAFPVTSSVGVSERHVVDLADLPGGGRFIVPTGQSGVPFSRHYRDQFELWRDGRLWRIPLDRGEAESRAVARMRLNPDNE